MQQSHGLFAIAKFLVCIGRAVGKPHKRCEQRTYDSDKAAHIVLVVASQHAEYAFPESVFPVTAAAATASGD